MCMTMEIYSVRPTTLARLLEDPPLVWQLVAPDAPEFYEKARAETKPAKSGFLRRLFGREAATSDAAFDAAEPLTLEADERMVADLDKAWHGIHFLLTEGEEGTAPLDFLIEGGDDIGDAVAAEKAYRERIGWIR